MNEDKICVSSPYGAVEMIDVDPQYFKKQVSTELKDQAKEKGLVHFDEDRQKIVLNDDPDEYLESLKTFELEQFLKMRVDGAL
jgi:hypothetical protein